MTFVAFNNENEMYKKGDLFYIKSKETFINSSGNIDEVMVLLDLKGNTLYVDKSYYEDNFNKCL